MSTPLLYGLHDREGAYMVPAGGWCVDTVALSENPAPTDYAALRGDINWIVRLNWGYGSTGTIPLPYEYGKMAAACAAYVANSKGAQRWIIGNEPNHEQERPNGVYIAPEDYALCFEICRGAIKRADPAAQVIPAPCAPYHANPTNWLQYWRVMLETIALNGGCDGIAVHAYTRSSNPVDIYSTAEMGPPLEGQYSGFWTYLDALFAVPASMRHLPAYITEFNELLPEGWDNRNTGVVQQAYADISGTNTTGKTQPVQCLCLYRWPKFDQWHIEGKQGVIADFQAAIGRGYQSPPVMGANNVTNELHLPFIPNDPPTVPAPALPREWDPRLTARGVTVQTPDVAPGEQFWRVTMARWYSEQQAGGRHHIYVDAPDGSEFHVRWPGGGVVHDANGRSGFDAGNFPMSKSLNEFSVTMMGGIPSETLTGIGMGADGNSGIHTSTEVRFELVTMPQATQPAPSTDTGAPTEPPVPTPPTPTPVAATTLDPLVLEAIVLTESGGDGFANGRLKVRVEGHLLIGSTWGNPAAFGAYFYRDAAEPLKEYFRRSPGDPWVMYHASQDLEWQALEFAIRLDVDAALRCTSMGAGQVMGFNARRVGYPSLMAMFEAFRRSQIPHMMAVINYCLSDAGLVKAIANKDWDAIVRGYNGKGYEHIYTPRLVGHYKELVGA